MKICKVTNTINICDISNCRMCGRYVRWEESADGQRIFCLENMAETISLSLDRNTLYDLLEENLYVIIPPRDHCIYVDFKKIGSNRPNKSLVRSCVCVCVTETASS